MIENDDVEQVEDVPIFVPSLMNVYIRSRFTSADDTRTTNSSPQLLATTRRIGIDYIVNKSFACSPDDDDDDDDEGQDVATPQASDTEGCHLSF